MYCINCGVKLADTEKRCPLCGVEAIHPDLIRVDAEPLYPEHRYPAPQVNSRAAQIVITTLLLMVVLTTLVIDLQINERMTWSGYVIGALAVCYVLFVLPYCFRKPNPVVFVPCGFGAIGVYLLYINAATGGHWFLSFAFPVTGYVGTLITAVVVLLKYLHRGRLYIIGGAAIALGIFMPLMEFLIYTTFDLPQFGIWFMYPLITLVLLGGMLIFLAICRPARETMERKFFL